MAHTTDYSEIYKTPSSGLSLAEVSKCLGEGSLDIGTLCTSAKIKPFARYKPEQSVLLKELAAEDRDAVNHSIVMPPTAPYTNAADLLGSNAKIKYQRPSAGYYRPLDFNGYYNIAPACVAHCTSKGVVGANVIDDNSDTHICFYLLMKEGPAALQWRAPSDTNGIGSTRIIPQGKESKCLAAEDVIPAWFEYSINNVESFFAVALFQNGTHKGTFLCSKWIDHYQVVYNEMFQLPIQNSNGGWTLRPTVEELGGNNQQNPQTISAGTYQAVACVVRGNRYYPLFPYGEYTNRFTLKLGGADMYKGNFQGGSFTENGTPSSGLTTNTSANDQIWLTFTLADSDYGKATQISAANLSRLKVTGTMSGDVTDSDGENYPISRTLNLTYTHTSGAINIPANGSVTLKFFVNDIWEHTGGTSGTQHLSGEIDITSIKLQYGNQEFPSDTPARINVKFNRT